MYRSAGGGRILLWLQSAPRRAALPTPRTTALTHSVVPLPGTASQCRAAQHLQLEGHPGEGVWQTSQQHPPGSCPAWESRSVRSFPFPQAGARLSRHLLVGMPPSGFRQGPPHAHREWQMPWLPSLPPPRHCSLAPTSRSALNSSWAFAGWQ